MRKILVLSIVGITACRSDPKVVYVEKPTTVIYVPTPASQPTAPVAKAEPEQVHYGHLGDDTSTTDLERQMAAYEAGTISYYPGDTTAASGDFNEDDYRLAPGTQTMLGDDGEYHGRVIQ